MADLLPLRALRFNSSLELDSIICPPFDTISSDLQQDLHDHNPHNMIHLELGLDLPSDSENNNRYLRAASTLREWEITNILHRDDVPSFYVYDQQFHYGGSDYTRRSIFARLRLEPWESSIVLPHERTFSSPKEDRLNLLRAINCNTSPIFLLYQDKERLVAQLLETAKKPPLANFLDSEGQRHRLHAITDPEERWRIVEAFKPKRLYVADGHHRYETALTYQDEQRKAGKENDVGCGFAMVALTDIDDPGLLVLPMHRLIQSEVKLELAMERLLGLFAVETMPSPDLLMKEIAQRGQYTTAVGLVAAESPELYLLTLLDQEAAASLIPTETREAWRNLDMATVRYAIMDKALSIVDEQAAYGHTVTHCEDAAKVIDQVRKKDYSYGIIVNPVRADQVLTVADAGQTMPQKSTFFYPKLPTGLLLNPLND